MRFEDFTVQIRSGPIAGEHQVSVTSSLAGDGQGSIEIPRDLPGLASGTLSTLLDSVTRSLDGGLGRDLRPGQAQQVVPRTHWLGKQLFDRLFAGQVRSRYDFCCGNIARSMNDDSEPTGLRIRLRLEPGDSDALSLCALPWELLWHEGDQGYLGLNPARSITRYLEVPQPGSPLPLSPPLRILVVVARPHGTTPLDLGLELRQFQDAVGFRDDIEVTTIEAATVDELQRALNRERFHVVHFAGHGTSGALVLEEDEGEPRRLHGAQLARLLQGPNRPTLVFLNACETARLGPAGGPNPMDLPLALLQVGIPAVLAMQFPISDPAAIRFSSKVYQAIAHGADIDTAVSEGRLAIYLADQGSLEWATPVLFLRETSLQGGRFSLRPVGPILVEPPEREPEPRPAPGEPKKLHVFQRDLYRRLDDLRIGSLEDYRRLNEDERVLLSREILDRIIGLGTRSEDLLEMRHVNTRFPSRNLEKPEIRDSLDVLHGKSAIYSDHSLVCVPKIELPGPYESRSNPPVLRDDVIFLLLQHRTLIETGRMSVVPDLVNQRGEKHRCLFNVQSLDAVKVDLDRPEVRTFFLDAGELFRPSGALVIQSREGGALPLPEILEIEDRYQAEYRHFQTHLKRSLTEMHPEGEAKVLQRALLEVDEGIRALDSKFEQHRKRQQSGTLHALASGALAIVLYATGADATSFLTSALASSSLGKLVSFVPDFRQIPSEIRQSPFFVPWLISRTSRDR